MNSREKWVSTGYLLGATAVALAALGSRSLNETTLPPGFEISIYAQGIQDARGLAVGDNGTLMVGNAGEGKMYAIAPPLGDEPATVMLVAPELDSAWSADTSGIAVAPDGALFVSNDQTGIVYRITYRAHEADHDIEHHDLSAVGD